VWRSLGRSLADRWSRVAYGWAAFLTARGSKQYNGNQQRNLNFHLCSRSNFVPLIVRDTYEQLPTEMMGFFEIRIKSER